MTITLVPNIRFYNILGWHLRTPIYFWVATWMGYFFLQFCFPRLGDGGGGKTSTFPSPKNTVSQLEARFGNSSSIFF